MFVGAVPRPLAAIVHEHTRSWDVADLHVLCSGNFTLERVLADRFTLHSNDVSIYTSVLGAWLAGDDQPVAIRDEHRGEWGWLDPYLAEPIDRVATIMLGTRAFDGIGRSNAYYDRMRRAYRTQWERLHAETVEKLGKVQLRLGSYTAQDAAERVHAVPADGAVCSFPPFYCLAPSERILTDDLRWVPCGDLREGDGILAFDEEPPPGARMRRWRFGEITRSERVVKDCVRVHLADGTSVVCTTDHPWLATDREGPSPRMRWVEASGLRGRFVIRLLPTWGAPETYDAGWLSGIYDGEGSMTNGQACKLCIAQRPGYVADRARRVLGEHGFNFGVHGRPNGVQGIEIQGGFAELLRALGTFRPMRLIEGGLRSGVLPSTRSWGNPRPRVRVVDVEPLGESEIQSISTSTRTYVGEGFAMHNSGGYENLYKGLDTLLEWDQPEYAVMDRDGLHNMIGAMRERRHWLYGTDHRLDGDEHEQYLRGVVQPTARNVPIYVYSSEGQTRWSGPSQTLEPLKVPRLGHDDTVGDRMALLRLTAGEFNALRAHHLDPRIAPAQADLPLAVLVDRQLVGVFALSRPKYKAGGAYLMSDFAISPTRYPRLSKLVLYAALSSEAQVLIERYLNHRVRSIVTTAFSDRPVSMKYRGLMKLAKRTELTGEPHAYQLHYEAPAGRWTLADALTEWKEKHGRTRDVQA